jgi:hypothetical protein
VGAMEIRAEAIIGSGCACPRPTSRAAEACALTARRGQTPLESGRPCTDPHVTRAIPARSRADAAAWTVAPVVMTSSTTATCEGRSRCPHTVKAPRRLRRRWRASSFDWAAVARVRRNRSSRKGMAEPMGQGPCQFQGLVVAALTQPTGVQRYGDQGLRDARPAPMRRPSTPPAAACWPDRHGTSRAAAAGRAGTHRRRRRESGSAGEGGAGSGRRVGSMGCPFRSSTAAIGIAQTPAGAAVIGQLRRVHWSHRSRPAEPADSQSRQRGWP